jgi:signal transduction histidine kinase
VAAVRPVGEGTPAEQVETTLFRALVVLRSVVLVYALVLNVARFDEFIRPGLATAALGTMVVWSCLASWAYDAPRRRRLPLYLADLAVAVLMVLSTPLVQSQAMLERHASTVPTFWVMAAVLAWAAGRHWTEALAAAAAVSVADVSVRTATAGGTWGNIFLLLLAAGVVGYTAGILREAAELRAQAERTAAVTAERTRLARAVHDGVLQVLALVQRRGTAAEGDLAELARVAGEQEAALRALIQYDARSLRPTTAGQADLMARLEGLHRPEVTLAGPGHPVELPDEQVEELVAVVGACLDNVRVHVGEGAPAWVLVEELDDAVVVSVRDAGPGIPDGRLAEAEQEGRMGVPSSIRGRMTELGGSATLVTSPGAGTEWELTLPHA